MKKYTIIIIAMLFSLTITAQRKTTTDELQVTSLKSVESLATDKDGNLIKGKPIKQKTAEEIYLETWKSKSTHTKIEFKNISEEGGQPIVVNNEQYIRVTVLIQKELIEEENRTNTNTKVYLKEDKYYSGAHRLDLISGNVGNILPTFDTNYDLTPTIFNLRTNKPPVNYSTEVGIAIVVFVKCKTKIDPKNEATEITRAVNYVKNSVYYTERDTKPTSIKQKIDANDSIATKANKLAEINRDNRPLFYSVLSNGQTRVHSYGTPSKDIFIQSDYDLVTYRGATNRLSELVNGYKNGSYVCDNVLIEQYLSTNRDNMLNIGRRIRDRDTPLLIIDERISTSCILPMREVANVNNISNFLFVPSPNNASNSIFNTLPTQRNIPIMIPMGDDILSFYRQIDKLYNVPSPNAVQFADISGVVRLVRADRSIVYLMIVRLKRDNSNSECAIYQITNKNLTVKSVTDLTLKYITQIDDFKKIINGGYIIANPRLDKLYALANGKLLYLDSKDLKFKPVTGIPTTTSKLTYISYGGVSDNELYGITQRDRVLRITIDDNNVAKVQDIISDKTLGVEAIDLSSVDRGIVFAQVKGAKHGYILNVKDKTKPAKPITITIPETPRMGQTPGYLRMIESKLIYYGDKIYRTKQNVAAYQFTSGDVTSKTYEWEDIVMDRAIGGAFAGRDEFRLRLRKPVITDKQRDKVVKGTSKHYKYITKSDIGGVKEPGYYWFHETRGIQSYGLAKDPNDSRNILTKPCFMHVIDMSHNYLGYAANFPNTKTLPGVQVKIISDGVDSYKQTITYKKDRFNNSISDVKTEPWVFYKGISALELGKKFSDIDTKLALKLNSGSYTGTASDLKSEIASKLSVESDPTVPSHVKAITTTNITNWNNKLDANTKIPTDIKLRSGTLNNKFSILDISTNRFGIAQINDKSQMLGNFAQNAIDFSINNTDTHLVTKLHLTTDRINLETEDLSNPNNGSYVSVYRQSGVGIGTTKNNRTGSISTGAGEVTLIAKSGSSLESKLQVTATSISLGKLVQLVPSVAPSPAIVNRGMVYFDMTDNKLKCYDGTTWQNLSLKADKTYVDKQDATKLDKGTYTGTASDLAARVREAEEVAINIPPIKINSTNIPFVFTPLAVNDFHNNPSSGMFFGSSNGTFGVLISDSENSVYFLRKVGESYQWKKVPTL